MIPTLAWKEYREQRGLWIAITCLGALLSFNICLLARGGLTGAPDDPFIHDAVIGILLTLIVVQGIVCGATLLAGEKETGTLAFLDVLSGPRFPVWWTKLVVGLIIVLAQVVELFGIMLALRLGSWGHLLGFMVAGGWAFCWGLLGGTLCERVFPAIASAIGLGLGTYALIAVIPIVGVVVFMISPLIFVALSKIRFCATDRQRGFKGGLIGISRPQGGPVGWIALIWLTEKQGRWLIWPGLFLSLLAGNLGYQTPQLLWQIATTIIGLICGIAVFAPEQAGEQDRFLGAQRIPPGQVWFFKTVFWMLVAAAMTGLLGLVMVVRHENGRWAQGLPLFGPLFGQGYASENMGLFLTLWVVHGFCIGQFCSLLSRKIVVTGFLGVAFCVFLFVLWLPSLAFGGIHAWQILGIPFFLLIAARLSMWLWYSGRMYTRRHVLGLVGCALVIAIWLGGNFWYRAVEVPDVGEPFDFQAFEAKLDLAKQSKAGPLIRDGIRGMLTRRKEVEAEWGPFTKDVFIVPGQPMRRPTKWGPFTKDVFNLPGQPMRQPTNGPPGDIATACSLVMEMGWPAQDSELGPRLDALFAGDWFQDIRAAATMPLGLVSEEGNGEGLKILLPVRALQLQARGDSLGALETLEICLGLARQFQNCNPELKLNANYKTGLEMEWYAFYGFDEWLRAIGSQPELLRKALKILQHHEKEAPDPLDNIKADYWMVRDIFVDQSSWFQKRHPGINFGTEFYLQKMLMDCPWETARRLRIINAVYQGQMRLAKLSPTQWFISQYQGKVKGGAIRLSWLTGLELADGGWSPNRWGNLLEINLDLTLNLLPEWPHDFPRNLREIRVRQVLIGLMLYQAEEGHAAVKLDDLVPRFLPTLPWDPWQNQPFDYKVSQGEEIEGHFFTGENPDKKKLSAGQALLWMDGISRFVLVPRNQYEVPITRYFPVPVWEKK